MGFQDVDDLYSEGDRIAEELRSGARLSAAHRARALVANRKRSRGGPGQAAPQRAGGTAGPWRWQAVRVRELWMIRSGSHSRAWQL